MWDRNDEAELLIRTRFERHTWAGAGALSIFKMNENINSFSFFSSMRESHFTLLVSPENTRMWFRTRTNMNIYVRAASVCASNNNNNLAGSSNDDNNNNDDSQ